MKNPDKGTDKNSKVPQTPYTFRAKMQKRLLEASNLMRFYETVVEGTDKSKEADTVCSTKDYQGIARHVLDKYFKQLPSQEDWCYNNLFVLRDKGNSTDNEASICS
eukprot:6145964-Ditylum_brightwellii.AAC.1